MEIVSTLASTLLSVALRSDMFIGGPQQVEATGSYKFTPAISQLDACRMAEDRAKRAILEKTQGSTYTADEARQCIENKDDLQCKQHNVMIESSRGVITEIVNREEHVHDWTCEVKIVAKVQKTSIKSDPNFDINAKLNRTIFEEGDTLSFDVDANASGFLTVFHYFPDTQTMVKIFPNRFQETNQIDGGLGIRAPNDQYKFKTTTNKRKQVNEYLYFVYTEDQISFFNNYTLPKFMSTVDSIRGKKQLVKKGFVIIKGEI